MPAPDLVLRTRVTHPAAIGLWAPCGWDRVWSRFHCSIPGPRTEPGTRLSKGRLTNPPMYTLMDEGRFFSSSILGLSFCSSGLLHLLAWVMGACHIWGRVGPQKAGAGRLGLSRSGLVETPAPLSCWGWGRRGGSANQLSPSFEAPHHPVSL